MLQILKGNIGSAADHNTNFYQTTSRSIGVQNNVNSEIDRLVKEGVLGHVDNSDWGTPIVPVLKKDGGMRLCADYKSTINQHMKDVKFVIPNIDDLFAALNVGIYFTKLDLRNAYNCSRKRQPVIARLEYT